MSEKPGKVVTLFKFCSPKTVNQLLSGPSTGSGKSEDYDPTLDIASELFDPLKAIRSKLKPPDPSAKVFDNLKVLEARIKQVGSLDKDLSTFKVVRPESKKQASISSQVKDLKTLSTSVRRFLPHQEPVMKPKRAEKNLFTRMEDKDLLAGPLGVLHRFMTQKTRVKVRILVDSESVGHKYSLYTFRFTQEKSMASEAT
jgi:hypothetical protein